MVVSSKAVVCQARDALAADMDGVIVIMACESGEYLELNAVACAVWRRISGPLTVGALCEELAAEYDGDPQEIEQDVFGFLQLLADKGIVELRA